MEGWKEGTIKSVATIGSGRDYKHLKAGNVPVFGTGGYMTSVNDFLHDGETVCIGRKGTIDAPLYHSGKIWTVDTLFYTHSFDNILPKLLFYIFQTIDWKIYNEATGVPSLSKKTIEQIKIIFPESENEQRQITTILNTIELSIAQTKQLIAKYKNVKRGLLNDLLSYGIDKDGNIRNPQTHFFLEKRGIIVPEEWTVLTLREICKIFGRIGFRGYTLADLVGEGYGAITLSPSNIKEGTLSFNDCTYISFFKYEESPEIKIYDGDILFVKTGSTYGKVAQVKNLPIKATINPQFVVLKEIQCNKVLLTYIMQSFEFQNKVKLIVGGSTIPTLSQEKLYELNIGLPKNSEEQNKISDILEAQDKTIESEKANLAKLQKLKQGLMQDLLTGKVRVKI